MKTLKYFATIVAMLLCCITANAYSFEVDGIYYNSYGSNSVQVTYKDYNNGKYNSYSGDVVIPETVTYNDVEYKVTSIGSSAFCNCSGLTSVTIPQGVTSIGSSAFYNCSGLTSVTIPQGVTSIGYETFYGCIGLTSVTIPQGVTSIGGSAFYGCSGLTSVTIPQGVTSISTDAFYGCSGLTSVTIPQGVTSIGSYAFYGCSRLTSVTIPQGVTTIGSHAFDGCRGLTSVYISSIEDWCNIVFNEDEYNRGSNPLYYADSLFLNGTLITDLEIPNTVTEIKDYAFYEFSNFTSINIPASVTSIGKYAFNSQNCEVKMSATTPPALASTDAFASGAWFVVPAANYGDYCAATYWADMKDRIAKDDVNVQNVALSAASDKSDLQVTIGDENLRFVTDLTISGTINSYDFMILRNKMPLLRNLDLSEATIVHNKYEHYTGYHTNDSIFPGYGLCNCKLHTLALPKNLKGTLGYHSVASNDYLKEIVIPEGVTSIGSYAFHGCSGLTSVTIPQGVTTIGSYAFEYCSGLTSVTIPQGVTSIGSDAFYGCDNLTNIILPPTLRNINEYAFGSCDNLKEIRIPSSVRTIGQYAFSGCGNLKDVYVYVVEPFSISQETFAKDGNNFIGTLHAPKVSYWDYYYDTQWSQFLSFAEFDEPYDNFYLEGDKVLDENTGSIEGEGGYNPDAEMGDNSGIIVEDDVNQDLGDVDIEHDGENGGSIIVDGSGEVNAEKLNFRINVIGGRWYFFCFPFDVRAEDIRCEGGAEWVFRYYDGEERAKNGKGGWKNVTSDGNGNFLKAATGYIFQCSKNDVLVLSAKKGKIKKEDKYNELVEHITQNTHDASWNFVGNPYLSYYEVNSEDYSAPITVWDGSKYIAIRPGDDDYHLAPFEAFFVQKPNGKDKVNYKSEKQMTRRQATEAAAAASARRSRQAIDPNRLLVNLTLSNGEETDRTRVVFNNNAAMEYETDCDAAKFSTQGVPQIYTMDGKGVKYAINERPTAQGSVSLGYSVNAKGTYTIEAGRMDVAMCLMDNLTGTVHDLTKGGYEFSSEAGTFDKRFTLFIKGDATAIENVQGSENDANGPIYNVKGQQVQKMDQGDVYIKDNRKVIK